jgi:hypothetical protein
MKARSIPLTLVFAGVGIFLCASSARAQSISVSASPSVITNEGEESTVTLTVSPPSSRNLAVNLVLTGTAAPGLDYVVLGAFNAQSQVIIPAGQATATLTLHSLYDDDGRFSESVVFNVIGGKRYRIGSPSHAQVTIKNVP